MRVSVGSCPVPAVACAVAALLVSGAHLSSQETVTAIRASWMIDAVGAQPIQNAVVVVRGNRIDAAGPRASVPVPAGANVIDLEGQTVMPGLIDAHAHLASRSVFPSRFGGPQQRLRPAAEQMLKVVRHARVILLSGTTTIRNLGDMEYTDLLFREAIEGGMHVGPRIVSAGLMVAATASHPVGFNVLDGPVEFRRQVRENFHRGAEWIKMTSVDISETSAQVAPDEYAAAIEEAHRLGMKVTVHATGRWGSAIRLAVAAGADMIEHARPLTDEIVELMLKHGTSATLTPMAYVGWFPTPESFDVMDSVNSATEWMDYLDREVAAYRKKHPENETTDRPFVTAASSMETWRSGRDMFQSLKSVQQQYLNAFKKGLPFTLGLDNRHGGMAWQMQFLVDAGIPPLDVVKITTKRAAELIGYGDRLGTIEKGKLADLISVQGNPLQDIARMRQIRLVMKDGRRYDTLSWR